ncbi:MAG: protocatechuate 3,4-dioxygenase [Deltaproteobacteria bacterium]
MIEDRRLSRRELLEMSFALGGAAILAPLSSILAQSAWMPTPEQVSGPFYPVAKPTDKDADLTFIQGKPGRAQGQILHLAGRVLNLKGEPIQGVEVEIWQANTFGRYTHPSDPNPAALDPNFEGYGVQVTDSEGRYRFKTIKPGAYPASATWTRPPHIHFSVTGKSYRLITQLYFEGEPLNEEDLILKNTADKKSLITKLVPAVKDIEPDALAAQWDIVLRGR